MSLAGKRVLVAIGGGIAAFKAVELVRELQRRGAKVRVVMTEAATHFVGAVTFAGITGEAAITDLWDPTYAGEVHVELGAWAEAIVVAPATANLLARAAHGLADDAVLATLAASDARVFFAPAMHSKMWRREATQEHTAKLVARGARMLGPTEGPLASGEVGEGRMLEPKELADALERALAPAERPWSGKRVLITAGPTHEAIDPVRYIANRSSGKMGFALAEAARTRGAEVTLVLGPVEAAPPVGVAVERVVSARDMHRAVMARALDSDLVIMAAAVADFRPKAAATEKIKKATGAPTLELEPNPDILADLGKARSGARPALVGFALETSNVLAEAERKRAAKGADMIVANAATALGANASEAWLVTDSGTEHIAAAPKTELAERILDAADRWVRP